ncbi:methylated-DNA--[protein]-cysteine S-methyltransferase [Bacillus sp. CECT 9360]|uniref:methylated-DNA--[protein]-cysteine S-methyltransferase n=1 Tax=Bacillus sp. CECT 9360 TaxID=2845821 RepID=UPI001E43E8D7|nr:methylated-DNA--[protein]-cysteine S-methyltransferase [Bacillus sp. CECT 9360]CAH0345866.1 Methylated-DNA--protein-cysteine methyltransferase, constitutive [Bacillus sp. CECT 9360]
MAALFYSVYENPLVGRLYLIASETELITISIGEPDFLQSCRKYPCSRRDDMPIFPTLASLFDRYFSGEDIDFLLPLFSSGTEFQKAVWGEISKIPYGETRTYSEIAMSINRPKAVRAVGQASRANPFPFIVPCHRVIGKNGSLTGYAGSKTPIKESLLKLEKAIV